MHSGPILFNAHLRFYTHTHTHTYMYTHVYVCVCVFLKERITEGETSISCLLYMDQGKGPILEQQGEPYSSQAFCV